MKILLAEDEPALAGALKKILENAGHFADAVGDGQTALDYAEGFDYDLIILDVMLPRVDGLEVVRTLRSRGESAPVLMLTARSAVSDKVAGLNAGADDYMTKPFDVHELLARVNAMTRRVGDVILNELRCADLVLNLDTAELDCGSESVQLSRRELEVARMLLANPRMTFTKEAFIVNIWGIDSEATDNNVEAYISFLRKKLKYLNSRVSIRNIQKVGYRLEIAE
ncbi:MAG: response regulator transcription factor [Oscillospiraceae bacterium]|nr:response regulator transcription factor [Oscillospiraceae bacterium]